MKKLYISLIVVFLTAACLDAQEITPYDSLHTEGRRLYREGQIMDALTVYEQILISFPEDVDALLFRGRLSAMTGNFELAEKDLKKVLKAAPDYADAYDALASQYFWKGDIASATEALQAWLERFPQDPNLYILNSRIAISQRQFALARDYLEKALKLGADKKLVNDLLSRVNRPEQKTIWTAGMSYRYEIVDSTRGDWQLAGANIIREFDDLTAIMSYDLHVRDTLVDHAVAVDAYADVWDKAYVNTRFQMSFNTDFLPIADVTLELFQGMGTRSEPSLGYRFMYYPDLLVHIPSLAFGYYPGKWYLRDKVSLIVTDDLAWQNIAAARYYPLGDVDTYVELMNVLGTEFNPVSREAVQSLAFALRGSYELDEQWVVSSVLSWTRDEYEIQRYAASLGAAYRW